MQDLFDKAEKTVWHPSNAKSQGTIRSNLKVLSAYIGDVPIHEVNYSLLETLVERLKVEKGYAPATIKRKLDMVSKALRMATKWTDKNGRPLLVSKPTMPTITVKNLRDRTVSRIEEVAIFNAIEARRQSEPQRQWARLEDLIRFLMDTGSRLGEALGVGPDDLGEVRGTPLITFQRYTTKNDKPRSIPLTPAAHAVLERRANDLGRTKDGKWLFFPIKSASAWYMFNQIRHDVKEAGFDIGDVTLHTLRHTAMTRLAQGGMDLLRLQTWAGHSDPKITAERYTHLTADDLLGGLDILSPSINTNPLIEAEDDGRPGNVPFPDEGANRDKLARHATAKSLN